MKKEIKTFDQALKAFVTSTANSKKYAHMAACYALEHFAEHGDTVHCQSFFEAIKKVGANYLRPAAYFKWLVNFAPIKMVNGRLVKDTSDKAVKLDIEGARVTTFWDYAPNMETIELFDAYDPIKAAKAVVARYKNDKKWKAKNQLAHEVLIKLEAAINTVQVPVNADLATVTPIRTEVEPAGEQNNNIGGNLDHLGSNNANAA